MANRLTITTQRVYGGWQAYFVHRAWDCGRGNSEAEAIGSLVIRCDDTFGVVIDRRRACRLVGGRSHD